MSEDWPKRMRRQRSVEPEEFWASEEKHEFRVNSNSDYAEVNKFKAWILREVEQKRNGKSYDEQVMQEYGDYDVCTDYEKRYDVKQDSPVFNFNREMLNAGTKKWKPRSELDYAFKPSSVLPEEYRIVD